VITASTFKDFFDRGQFDYGPDLPKIRDKDIDRAIAEAMAVINQGIYPNTEALDQAAHYLTAHFLFCDVDAADGGGQPIMLQSGRSADGLSESLSLPAWATQGEFAFYTTTYYGQKWLHLTAPHIGGAVYCVAGATQP
jgi:hypothetical protein